MNHLLNKMQKVNYINLLLNIMIVIGLIFLIASFSGCASKPETITVTKYKYIEKPVPQLKVYQGCDVDISLTTYNHKGKVCVEEWDGCIDKNAFLNLAQKIITLKSTCELYQNEVIEFNKRFADKNQSK